MKTRKEKKAAGVFQTKKVVEIKGLSVKDLAKIVGGGTVKGGFPIGGGFVPPD
jgi:hypothetical protein